MCTFLPSKPAYQQPAYQQPASNPASNPASASGGQPDPEAIAGFAAVVANFYRDNGRSFPWRETLDPWRILVSELMLQQTQTQRVLPKYLAWFEHFPDMQSLAAAPLETVYAAWKGLGYNNRAMRLRACARILCEQHGAEVPSSEAELLALPGIGQYTARAIQAFAWNRPTVFLETNIRSALIFHFFDGTQPAAGQAAASRQAIAGDLLAGSVEKITDRQLLPFGEASLAAALSQGQTPRHWYYALMDYGVYLKKMEVNPSRRSQAYTRQSRFEGSLRQVRGALLAALQSGGSASLAELAVRTAYPTERLEKAATALVAEGLLGYQADRLGFRD